MKRIAIALCIGFSLLTAQAAVVIDDFQTQGFNVTANQDGFNVAYLYEPDPAHMIGGARQLFMVDPVAPSASTGSLVPGQGYMTYNLAQAGGNMLLRHSANYDLRAAGADTVTIDLLSAPAGGHISLRLIDQAQTISHESGRVTTGPGIYAWAISEFTTAAPGLPMDSLYLDLFVSGAQGTYQLSNFQAVPEPSTYALAIGFALAGFGAYRRLSLRTRGEA